MEHACIEWPRGKSGDGYGVLYLNRRPKYAHRHAYEVFRGPIPTGLVIDHLCRNRACIDPEHMEPVTPAENHRRGIFPGGGAFNRAKVRCPRGHAYDDANTYVNPNNGGRLCRCCHREHERRYRARRSATFVTPSSQEN